MSVIRDLFSARRAPRTAFVCGGGANLGAVQVGMLKALLSRDIIPDVVVGCSVGALNGAAIAADPRAETAAELAELWENLTSQDVFPPGRLHGPWQLVRRGWGVYRNSGLREVIERWLPYRSFEETRVPLHVVATSMREEIERWFSSGPVVEPLLASCALPAVYPPVRIGDEYFIDGGVVNNVPISRALELGARRVYVLHVGNFKRRRPPPSRPIDVLVQAFSIARSHRFRSESGTTPDGVEIVVLPAVDPGPLRYNDFSRSAELIAGGERAAGEFLDSHSAAAGI